MFYSHDFPPQDRAVFDTAFEEYGEILTNPDRLGREGTSLLIYDVHDPLIYTMYVAKTWNTEVTLARSITISEKPVAANLGSYRILHGILVMFNDDTTMQYDTELKMANAGILSIDAYTSLPKVRAVPYMKANPDLDIHEALAKLSADEIELAAQMHIPERSYPTFMAFLRRLLADEVVAVPYFFG